jgi:hypothetical protein
MTRETAELTDDVLDDIPLPISRYLGPRPPRIWKTSP